MEKRIPVIIDTDLGDDIDDAFALCLAMASPEIELIGVTTVQRCAYHRAKMAKALLIQGGYGHVPVHVGVSKPLAVTKIYGREINYEELPHSYDSEYDNIEPDGLDAINFLIETLENSKEKITIVTLGALTNIAILLQRRPDLCAKIEKLSIMGGAFCINLGEYNFSCDPNAADIVLNSNARKVVVGIDITFKCKFDGQYLNEFRASEKPHLMMLNRMNKKWTGDVYLHDPLALMVVFKPEFVTFEKRVCKVETNAEYANAYVINLSDFNWRYDSNKSNLVVGIDVKVKEFIEEYSKRILEQVY